MRRLGRFLVSGDRLTTVMLVLFGLALLVRIVGLVAIPDTNISTNAKTAILGGARLISEGQFIENPAYPTLVPPITLLYVAGVQSVFGPGLFPVKLLQSVVDAVTVVIVFNTARLVFPYFVVVIASLILAIYPFTAFAALYIGTEALFSFFLALFVYCALRGFRDQSTRYFLVSGLALGLATLTRGTTLYFPLIFKHLIIKDLFKIDGKHTKIPKAGIRRKL